MQNSVCLITHCINVSAVANMSDTGNKSSKGWELFHSLMSTKLSQCCTNVICYQKMLWKCSSGVIQIEGNRLWISVGMWQGSYCYQERSDGLCLWRASEWWTLSLKRISHHLIYSKQINDNEKVCVLSGSRSDRKCANQCWISFSLVPFFVTSALIFFNLP